MVEKVVYFIEGDGIGPEVWAAGRPVIDAAVAKAYGSEKKLVWKEILAGEKALRETGENLPQATLDALKGAELAMKGPLGTPVGKGFRSLNVTLRQMFDLYACIRPIKYFPGIESPVKHPERVDMVIFRENTEDVYAGIEWEAGTPEAKRVVAFLRDEMGAKLDDLCAIGIKPMTEAGCKRLARRAVKFAIDQKRPSVTLVHKGNIMKFTEGGFRAWGYEMAAQEFGEFTMTEAEAAEGAKKPVIINDRIADAMFQEALIRPEKYSVIATTNLNGDYISDALAAQVGGIGIAPGANISDHYACFEATHGTAPKYAGLDKVNPGSLILSAEMMLRHLGWLEAANLVIKAMEAAIGDKKVTYDFARLMEGADELSCSAFGEAMIERM